MFIFTRCLLDRTMLSVVVFKQFAYLRKISKENNMRDRCYYSCPDKSIHFGAIFVGNLVKSLENVFNLSLGQNRKPINLC